MSLVRQRQDRPHTGSASAVIALGHLGDPRPIQLLLHRLDTGWDKNTTARALGQIGDAQAIGPMRAILSRLQDSPPDSDAGRRLNQLYISSIEDALAEIARLNSEKTARFALLHKTR
jgi:HEAT repeat protein